MNSIGNVLKGFEWDYEGTVSIMRGTGYQGKGVSRTMFLSPKLAEIPAELFAIKISQSPNPSKAGKPVFRFFSFRFNEQEKYQNMAPTGITMETPLEDVKNMVVSKLGNIPTVQVSLNINLNGSFCNVTCADGTYAIFDDQAEDLKNPDPGKSGDAPYYIKSDAVLHVHLKGAMSSQGNEYIQSTLSTTATSNDVFQDRERGKIWKKDDGGFGDQSTPAAGAGTPSAVW